MSKLTIESSTASVASEYLEIRNDQPNRGGTAGGKNAERRREQEERQEREEKAKKWNLQYNRNAHKYDEDAYPGTVLGLPPPISNSARDMDEYQEAFDALRVIEIEKEFKRFGKRLPYDKGPEILKHRVDKGGYVDAFGVLHGPNNEDTLPASRYPPLTAKEIERKKQLAAKVNKGSALTKGKTPQVRGKDRQPLYPGAMNTNTGPKPGSSRPMSTINEAQHTGTRPKEPSKPAKQRKLALWEKSSGYTDACQRDEIMVNGKPRKSYSQAALNAKPYIKKAVEEEKPKPYIKETVEVETHTSISKVVRQSTGAIPKVLPVPTTRLKPPSPTRSGIVAPSAAASGIRPPSPTRSDIRAPSASGIRAPSASGIRPPFTSGLRPPSTSGLRPPSTSGLRPPSTSGLRPPSATTSGLRPPGQHLKAPQARAAQKQKSPPREAVNAQAAHSEAQSAYAPVEAQDTEPNLKVDAGRFVRNPYVAAEINKRLQERQQLGKSGFVYKGLPRKPQAGGSGEPTVYEAAADQLKYLNEPSPPSPGRRRTAPKAARNPATELITVMNPDGSPSPRQIRVPSDVAQEVGAVIAVLPNTNTAVRASPSLIYFSPEREATSPAYSVPSPPSRTPPGPPPQLFQIRHVTPSPRREAFEGLGADLADGLDDVNLEDVDDDLVSSISSASSGRSQSTPKRRSPGERMRREAHRAAARVNKAERRRLQKSPEHLSFNKFAEDFGGGLDDEVLEAPEEINLVSPPSPSRSRRSPRTPEQVNLVTPPSSRPRTQPRSTSPRRSPRRPSSQPEAISPGEQLRREAQEMVARVNAAERNRLAAVDKAEDKTLRRLRDRLNALRQNFVDVADVNRQVDESVDARYEEAERQRRARQRRAAATPEVIAEPPPPPPPKTPTPPREKPRWRREEMEGARAPSLSPSVAKAEAVFKGLMENLRDINVKTERAILDVTSTMQVPRLQAEVFNLSDLVEDMKNSLKPQ